MDLPSIFINVMHTQTSSPGSIQDISHQKLIKLELIFIVASEEHCGRAMLA
jgi:hypothetical protein